MDDVTTAAGATGGPSVKRAVIGRSFTMMVRPLVPPSALKALTHIQTSTTDTTKHMMVSPTIAPVETLEDAAFPWWRL